MLKREETLLEIVELKKYFTKNSGLKWNQKEYIKAIDGVDLKIKKGETFGLVGESGCGKSTIGKTIIRLYDVTEGKIIFDGVDISNINNKRLKNYRKRFQMIFQDPYSSLNGRMSVGEIIGEPLNIHKIASGKKKEERVMQLLEMVGLRKEYINRYPHEFSGGQRQRIGIARALAVEPEFIVCDEPTSSLDVSIQAQVINMLAEVQKEMGLTYLFISHDLAMVQNISDRIGVMYLGKIMEIADNSEMFNNPIHPYTKALLSAVPTVDFSGKEKKNRIILKGDVPSPIDIPTGCRFRTRCEYATDKCIHEEPKLKEIYKGHMVACHLAK